MNTSTPSDLNGVILKLEDLQRFIDEREPENLHRDFKGREALPIKAQPGKVRDSRRQVLVQDVTALSNADGGMLIYGIATGKDGGEEYAKEWSCIRSEDNITVDQLTEIITSGTEPTLTAFSVYSLKRTGDAGEQEYCFIVAVGKSHTAHMAHMAPDGRYYARIESTTKIMRDWQVRDVMNRRITPRINAKILFNPNTNAINAEGAVIVDIYNIGSIMVRHVMVELKLPHILHGPIGVDSLKYMDEDDDGTYFLSKIVPDPSEMPLFPDSTSRVQQVVRAGVMLRRRDGSEFRKRSHVGVTIYADEMQPIRAEIPVDAIINSWVRIGEARHGFIKGCESTLSHV